MPFDLIGSSVGGALIGGIGAGWFIRRILSKFWDRADNDHDDLVRLVEWKKQAVKDIGAYHQKIRDQGEEINDLAMKLGMLTAIVGPTEDRDGKREEDS